MTSRTNNSNFLTVFVVPLDLSREGKLNGVTDTPTFRTIVEGSNIRGMRCDQILVHRDCEFHSNEFKSWFQELNYRLVPGARITII